jgi:tetratricopeptide (TPR) repeat protein
VSHRAMACLAVAALALAGCQAGSPMYVWHAPSARASDGQIDALNQAVMLVGQRQYADAADKLSALLAGLRTAGDRQRSAEAMFWLGYCYEKQGGPDVAATWYRRAVRVYPWTPAARLAAERLRHLGPARPPPPERPAATAAE